MSRSSSAGDLVPKDITEILALQQASKKKRGSSLGRAFSWFKGSKHKRSLSNGHSRSGGPCGQSGESTTAKQIHASGDLKAVQKQNETRKLTVHYTASQHYQENVFIEGSRPQYLEDLHSEAQEGLKILQQEEVPEAVGISPPPSPPPEHHPLPPPTKKMSGSSVSIPPSDEDEQKQETEEQVTLLESSWPPPPPPEEESTDLIFEEQDELNFPPPPPSFIHKPLSEIFVNCHDKSCEQPDNIELRSSNASDMASRSDQESEILTILPTRTVQNDMEDRQQDKPCNNVSHGSVDGDGMENTTVAPLKMSSLLSDELVQGEEMPAQDSEQTSLDTEADSTNMPLAPPLPVEEQSTVNFQRHLSLINKDNRSKELLCHHKSTPIPKEDANIPLVTPSLLQMVRLRSVTVDEDQATIDCKPSTESTTNENHSITSQATPQKPIRKSLTLKSNSPAKSTPAPTSVPSMRLQEAIRMKTAAMSSSGVPAMLNLRLTSTSGTSPPVPSPKTPDGCDLHKSPASTASFIFSKSTKKIVIETPTSPEIQASLKPSLAAEIMQISNQAKTMVTNGTKKSIKVPPPVAKKPVHGTIPPNKTDNATPDKTEILTNKQIIKVDVNGQSDQVHPAGQ
ncbi:hypothetical protein cypCar_00020681 [Cyprinus carpio]|nr:hypothetical protein cypCar_00020681 [Cyprinus carpio]